MDTEEIWARSRKENQNRDPMELEALSKANAIAVSVGMMMSGLLSLLHTIFADRVDFGIWSVQFSIMAATMLVKYVKLRQRYELLMGLFYLGCCSFFFVLYLRDLLGAV